MRINNNIMALQSLKNATRMESRILKHSQRLSTGVRINSAKDDAAGLGVSNKIINQIRGIDMANRNSLDGISLIQTAEGALGEITSMLQRIRELSLQTANGAMTDDDRMKAQYEIDSLLNEIDAMSFRTEYNNIKLLYGEASSFGFSGSGGLFDVDSISNHSKNGALGYTLIKAGVPAKISSNGISGGIGGNLFINGVAVSIYDVDTEDMILEKIRSAASASNIHVLKDGDNVHLVTDKTGSQQVIEIGMDNPYLANSLGFVAGTVTGIDAVIGDIHFVNENGDIDTDYIGSFSYYTDGNKITFENDSDKIVINVKTMLLPNGDLVLADGTSVTDAGIISRDVELSLGMFNKPLILQIGQNKDMDMEVSIPKITSGTLNIDGLLVTSIENSSAALQAVDAALLYISDVRASLGAFQNRLQFVSITLDVSSGAAGESLSRIMDTDMAKEMTNYTQATVISQAATSVLAQANQRPQQILQLLR